MNKKYYTMSSQLIKQCIQNSLYRINSVRINARFLCQIPTKVQQNAEENTNVKSKNVLQSKYLGYEIIYKLPHINYITLYNKAKRNMLIGTGMMIPVMCIISEMNILSDLFCILFSGLTCSFTISLYIVGILLDNQIGIIYYKDNKSIKIAYVDIWGKRVDIDTSIEDIKSLTDSPAAITDRFYRTIHVKSLKYPLKLIVKNSIIVQKDRLVSILGDYE